MLQVSEGVHADHPTAGRPLKFSSALEPKRGEAMTEEARQEKHEAAAAEMKQWWAHIRAAQLHNLGIDSGKDDNGNVRMGGGSEGTALKGVKYAVASMPGEEFGLRQKLTYGTKTDFKRAFNEGAASNLCVWTLKNGFLAASGK